MFLGRNRKFRGGIYMRIFISGQVSNKKSLKKFDDAKEYMSHVQTYDHDEIVSAKDLFEDYLNVSTTLRVSKELEELANCNAIYMLTNWDCDNIARLEHDYASLMNYRIIYSKKY